MTRFSVDLALECLPRSSQPLAVRCSLELFSKTTWRQSSFKMFLRREGIARVLDPAKDPRKLYVLPELPQSIPETPATVSARTPVGRATRSGAEEITSSPKTQFAHERFQQSVRTERRVVQEKYDSWDRDCERAFGYLHDAIPAEDRRRVARRRGRR